MLCACILVFRLMSSLTTHTSQPRELGRTFTEEAQKHLRVRCADKKTAIVSSHQELALRVARQLGLQKEAAQTQTVRLGVDVSAGETRTVTSARRKKRIQKVIKRKARLQVPTRRAGSLAQKDLQVWPAPSCCVRG